MDRVHPRSKPPQHPQMVDYVFFHHGFIILFQFLDIIFTLKSKKNMRRVDSAGNPPPPKKNGLSPQKCFFLVFFNLPLIQKKKW